MNNTLHNIEHCIEDYFFGTHEGDIRRVEKAFHPDCKITGFINDQYIEMTREQFCERIAQAAKTETEKTYDKHIVSIDIHQNIAMVKARVLVGDIYFTDYITLLNLEGQWCIRQKSFTDAL